VTDSTGAVRRRIDNYPFGDEIAQNNRQQSADYTAGVYPTSVTDLLSPKFTGKERDGETGLDYFEARYLSAAQSRFTSPDPEGVGSVPRDPQSWNMFSYGRNNPLTYTDPFGTNYTIWMPRE
jgi:RHS repeat-associated protein